MLITIDATNYPYQFNLSSIKIKMPLTEIFLCTIYKLHETIRLCVFQKNMQ